jgi:ribosomal protein S18 acetylase RimI-like enzyme
VKIKNMIRLATATEADEIARIINAAFEIEREFRQGERTSPSEIRKLINRETFLVVEQMGRLIAVVEVRVEGTTGYFGMLAVDPSARRVGVGRVLVEAAEKHCRGTGCTVMTLSTGEDRTELIPYYEKMGYRVTAIEPSTSAAFKRVIRIVKMEKPLKNE